MVSSQRAHLLRPQRFAFRCRRTRQATAIRASRHGPALRRAAFDDFRNNVEPAKPVSQRSAPFLFSVRRAAAYRRDRSLCPRWSKLVGQARLLHAAVDIDEPGNDGTVTNRSEEHTSELQSRVDI